MQLPFGVTSTMTARTAGEDGLDLSAEIDSCSCRLLSREYGAQIKQCKNESYPAVHKSIRRPKRWQLGKRKPRRRFIQVAFVLLGRIANWALSARCNGSTE